MAVDPKDFFGKLFLARDVAHSAHWNTRSFSKHMALDAFYKEIVELTDTLAEHYQGRYGLIGPINLQGVKEPGNITDFLAAQMAELEKERYELCEKSDTPLQNLIDEIVELYLETLYKLRFLA
jgi:hypothetical protein